MFGQKHKFPLGLPKFVAQNRTVAAFIKQLLLLSGLVVLALLGISHYWPGAVLPVAWYLLAYFVVVTLATYLIVERGLRGDPLDFSNGTMAATGVRLFISAGILFFYYWQVKEQNLRVQFTITFFALYFLYSGFEIKALLSKLRRNSGKP
jgi:uncharacterized membrane protein